jgi:two-component system OmpR family sensor kinase
VSTIRRAAARLSTRVRLTIMATAASAVVFAVGAILVYATLGSSLSRAVTDELRIHANDVAAELIADAPVTVGGRLTTQLMEADGDVLDPPDTAPLLTTGEVEAALHGELVVDRPVEGIGDDGRILARTIDAPGQDAVVVVVAGSTSSLTDARNHIALVLMVAAPVVLLGIGATAWLATGRALRSVRGMSRRAATLSLEHPEARLPRPPGNDEIAQLGQTLNEMLDRIATPMAHERAFVDHASHELRTPLAVLRGELELALADLRESGTTAGVEAALTSALEETDRLSRLAQDLLVLARADAGQLTEATGVVPLRSTAADIVARYPLGVVAVEVTGDGDEVWARAGSGSVHRIVGNLLDNALRHTRTRVEITVDARPDGAVLRVLDDGPGFAPSMLDRALDRFTRADDPRRRSTGGAGLGLAIVAAETEAHGGRTRIGNGGALGGAWVEVRLPLTPAPGPDERIAGASV